MEQYTCSKTAYTKKCTNINVHLECGTLNHTGNEIILKHIYIIWIKLVVYTQATVTISSKIVMYTPSMCTAPCEEVVYTQKAHSNFRNAIVYTWPVYTDFFTTIVICTLELYMLYHNLHWYTQPPHPVFRSLHQCPILRYTVHTLSHQND